LVRWFASSLPVKALVVDDTCFPKDGDASPAWPGSTPARWARPGTAQVDVSVHLVSEHASCAADCGCTARESWDEQALEDPAVAAGAQRRRERTGVPP
jgi:hypothetical protein